MLVSKNKSSKELNDIVNEIIENNEIDMVPETEDITVDSRSYFINKIEQFIQNEVDRLNSVKGIKLENKISCKLYGETPGYTYKQECIDLWNWSVSVYEAFREWEKTLTAPPTLDEFKAKLETLRYDKTYQ